MSRSSIVAQSKEAERRIARVYGGRRLHAGEWCGKGDVDVIHPTKAIQVKHRSNVAAYILEGMQQAQEAAEDTKELGRLLGDGPHVQCYGVKPVLVIVTKPGSGRPSRMFQVTEVFDNGDL
jgi:hypothetical protein